ncbi:MAG: hypothetical protein QOH76_1714, partial [Thermoleophilaceae bacterium]|nr:hypothetical protein [Thermoleophilaceae bacterium]
MICEGCGHINPKDSRYCGSCGAAQALTCPECDARVVSGNAHCTACGHALHDGATPPPSAGAERKLVTVLFADLQGSMQLSGALADEQWLEITESFVSILVSAVDAYGGTVDKFTGDGIMAVFGAPVAQEDHAARACLAALDMQSRLAAWRAEVERAGQSTAVRIGLNSGDAIVGALGRARTLDYAFVGHSVGVAQRMESIAEPNTIYLAEATARLVRDRFELTELGERTVKGVSEPIRVFRLEREAGSTRRPSAPLVGRESELLAVQGALDRLPDGGIVTLSGDPGVGKSR